MKKYIITAAVFTACLALCAAVWPQTGMIEETPAAIQTTVVNAPAQIDENIAAETETTPQTEEEKTEIPQVEPLHEDITELAPVPEEVPTIPESQLTIEPEEDPEPVHAPELTPAPVPSQTVTDPQPGDMVYVPGFGWLECRGIGEVIYAADIYENGNKVGSMG